MKVTLLPVARREMLRAADWYDTRAIGLGNRFLDCMRDGIHSIKEFPQSSPSIGEPYRRKILTDFPCGLIFCIRVDRVVIIAVAHLKRKPEYWKRRSTDPPANQ